jgi:carbon monoxide dehydrogenase subunit G
MELSGQQLLPVPRDRVWSALIDPETLRAAIPGCEYVNEVGEGLYSVGLFATVGSVRARFKGRMQQEDVQAPHRCTLSFEGDGGFAGFAKGSAEIELLDAGDGRDGTRLTYRAQAQIGGRVAQLGSRFVDATAARLSAQFFERLTRAIVEPSPAAPSAADAPASGAVRASEPMEPAQETGVPIESASPSRVPAPHVGVSVTAGMVTIQLPAWAFAFAVAALVALIGWLAVH